MLEVQIYKKLAEFDLDVSFQVDDYILGLMGTSGSGKSMTLKCIAGIETPDQGRIVLNGRVLFDSEKKINVPIQRWFTPPSWAAWPMPCALLPPPGRMP